MWKRNIEGITMPAQQEQTRPWDILPEFSWPSSIHLIKDGCWSSSHTQRGPYTPYFGSLTTQRARKAPIQVLSDENIKSLLKTSIEEKTDIPIDQL